MAAPFAVVDAEDVPTRSGRGDLHVTGKFANYALEAHDILLGYGLRLHLPTGDAADGIGDDHLWELEPFLTGGIQSGRLEIVGWARFGIPTNQRSGEAVETEFAYDLSALVRASPRVQALLELNGVTGMSGPAVGSGEATIAPGLKVAPLVNRALFLGAGFQVPLSRSDLTGRLKLLLFWHF